MFNACRTLLVLAALGMAACSSRSTPAKSPATETSMPGFKFMVLLKKQDNISFEQYERYFFDKHLPFVLKIPGLRGYKVNLRHPEDTTAPYDGISEFWFDDRAAFDAAMASQQTQDTMADAATFLQPPQIFLVDERVVLPPSR
jgi:uncharacterized protein (TIGR02118 family)